MEEKQSQVSQKQESSPSRRSKVRDRDYKFGRGLIRINPVGPLFLTRSLRVGAKRNPFATSYANELKSQRWALGGGVAVHREMSHRQAWASLVRLSRNHTPRL